MNATKRKFSALLNGIGNKSTTSLSSQDEVDIMGRPESLEVILKKQRIIPASTRIAIANSTLTVPSKSNLIHKKSPSYANVLKVPTTPPKYAPWDRTAFLERLKSFSSLTDWSPKPTRVNEVEWAKRGWVCQRNERVRCCLCNVEILVKLNKKEVDGKEEPVYVASNIEEAVVDKYVELIVTSHDENCLWSKRGCDDTIFKLPLNDAPITLGNIRERYEELCLRKDTLPYEFNLRLPESFSLETIMSYLPQKFFSNIPDPKKPNPLSETEINKTALILALFGWQGHTHSRLGVQPGSISCKACFRVLGLWLFKSKAVSPTSEETEGPIMNCLDPILEHREYCPWRNAVSQNGRAKLSTSDLAGWEIVQTTLKNEYYLRHGADVGRPVTAKSTGGYESFILAEDEEAERSARDVKDKERWVRLRRVKSLFDTKGTKKSLSDSKGGKKSVPNMKERKKLQQTIIEKSKMLQQMIGDKDKPV